MIGHGLILLCIVNDVTSKVDFEDFIDDFYSKNATRLYHCNEI